MGGRSQLSECHANLLADDEGGQDAQKALTVLNNIETKEIPKAGEAFGILILLRRHGRDLAAPADFLQTPRRLSMR